MGHWARIDDNNVVQEVIVIKESELDTGNWGDKSKWIKTSYNTRDGKHYVPKEQQDWGDENPDQSKALRFRFESPGMTYDATNDVFIPQKLADYMVLNKTTWVWEHPVSKPNDGFIYKWDEDVYKSDNSKGWVLDMPDKPFNSWIWNKDAQRYEAPIDEPSDSINSGQTVENGKTYKWDEDLYQSDNTKGWIEIT